MSTEIKTTAFNTTITLTVSDERARDLLVSALEGGSNYWFRTFRIDLAPGVTRADFGAGGVHAVVDRNIGVWPVRYVCPFVEGCALLVEELNEDTGETTTHRLDRAAIQRGLQLMATGPGVPRRYISEFLEDNTDAVTGDVFLQLCLLGSLVYG